MPKTARFADEQSEGEILLETLERHLDEALQRAADAQEDVAIWRRMLTILLRAAPRPACDRFDPWSGLDVPPRSAMH
jgi:hypothetical protein